MKHTRILKIYHLTKQPDSKMDNELKNHIPDFHPIIYDNK